MKTLSFASVVFAITLALVSCRSSENVLIDSSESPLQRIVLPGIVDLGGKMVNPIELFRWVETEARTYDPAKDKVRFELDINAKDIPNESETPLQHVFRYRQTTGQEDRVTLPDAIKFYASILGLKYKFRENAIVIHSVAP